MVKCLIRSSDNDLTLHSDDAILKNRARSPIQLKDLLWT